VRPRLYTTSRCGYCLLLKRYLSYRQIEFDEVNVDDRPEEQARLNGLTGGTQTVPTVVVGDQVLVNARGPEVLAALARQG
jgi:glutaredoxin